MAENILAFRTVKMKIPIGLLLLSIGLAFAAGFLALQILKSDAPAFNFSTSEINQVKRNFREKTPVISELNTAELFPLQADLELIDPRNVYTAAKGRPFSQVAKVFKAIEQCRPNLILEHDLGKAREWIAYQCHKIPRLSNTFFEKPPFLFPLGQSFAALAYWSEGGEFKNDEWAKSHIRFFHALELKNLPQTQNTDPRRQILAQLEPETLLLLIAGQSWIIDPRHVFVKRTADLSFNNTQGSQPAVDYLIYSRADWNAMLSKYQIETQAGTTGCLYHEDGLCWTESPRSATSKFRWSVGVLFTLALALVGFCIIQIIRTIREQKYEDERKLFALRTLAHELRTPLSSLVISSEQLMRQFEAMPSSLHGDFLRIFDDVQRLTRVAETSHHYLSTRESKGVVPLELVLVPSVNNFVESALERHLDEIVLTKLDIDVPFKFDQYWLGVCLQNLVQNACQHGRKPIQVSIAPEGSHMVFSVSDSGTVQEEVKGSILEPFSKRTGSNGLGLGLSIVATVARAMGAKLKVSFNPTIFELWIEGA